MKKVITLMLALVAAMAVNAKTVETTVWEGSEAISWNTAVAPGTQFETPSRIFSGLTTGNVVKIYTTTTYENPQYVVTYKAGDSWTWTNLTITVDGGVISFTVENATMATEIADRGLVLRGQAWTANKITVSKEVVEYTAVNVWSGENVIGDWNNDLQLTGDARDKLAEAFMNDIIRVTYTTTDDDTQIQVSNSSWTAIASANEKGTGIKLDYTITTATALEDIQLKGINVQGKNVTVTAVDLLKASNRYDAAPVTIGDDEIATFSNTSKHLDFASTGITPYYVSEIAKGEVKLTAVTTTWSYQGYVLKGAAGTYDVPVVDKSQATYPNSNYLKPSGDWGTEVAPSTDGTYHYIFAKNSSGKIGFFKYTGTANKNLAAHKAYLETTIDITPSPDNARVALIFDDDTTTKVEFVAMPSQPAASGYYDLQGRQVKNPTKGLYIVNGKKIMVK